MKQLNAEATANAMPYPALVESLHQVFADGVKAPLRHHHTLPKVREDDATLLLMPAWAERYGCVKVVTVTPGNAARSLPAVTASVLVFDNQTGRHIALLDGATLTARRTAAASALGAHFLGSPDACRLLVVGAGRVSAELPAAFSAVRPIEQVMVWNPTAERGKQRVAAFRAQGFNAKWCPDLPMAVKAADIISCATLASRPLIKGEWLMPGQHLDLIGAFTPTMREADDRALQRARLYVDTEGAIMEAGEISIPLASGAIQRKDILGTLYDLCQHDQLLHDPEEISCFKAAGNAVMDLAAAMLVMQARPDI